MQQFSRKFSDEEERHDFIQWTLEAVEIKCNVCHKLMGYYDGWREDHNAQEPTMFFCVSCRRLAEKE